MGFPCWPVRPALHLYVCAFSAIMCDRNGDPDRSRSSLFRFFIVGKMHFRALIIAHIFRFWMHTRAHGGTLSFVRQLLSQLYFFCYQIAPIIVASYNRTFSFSALCQGKFTGNERVARIVDVNAALNVKNILRYNIN